MADTNCPYCKGKGWVFEVWNVDYETGAYDEGWDICPQCEDVKNDSESD